MIDGSSAAGQTSVPGSQIELSNFDAIPPGFLGFVERFVHPLEDGLDVVLVGSPLRNTDADSEWNGLTVMPGMREVLRFVFCR